MMTKLPQNNPTLFWSTHEDPTVTPKFSTTTAREDGLTKSVFQNSDLRYAWEKSEAPWFSWSKENM